MNEKIIPIKEAVFTISEEIKARRKSILVPLVIMIAGIIMIVLSYAMNENNHFTSSLLSLGITVTVIGTIFALLRLLNKNGQPYYAPMKSVMTQKVSYLNVSNKGLAVKLFDERKLDALESLTNNSPSPLMLVRYMTPDQKVMVMQIQEYVPHMYIPVTETVLMKR